MSQKYTNEEMKDSLVAYIMLYQEMGIKNMITRNRHMNEYSDEDFDETLALELLNQFVAASIANMKLEQPQILDICDGFVKTIPFLNDCDIDLPEMIKEAVLVDFINYVAGSHGLDYAMYTSDIAVEEVSEEK